MNVQRSKRKGRSKKWKAEVISEGSTPEGKRSEVRWMVSKEEQEIIEADKGL